MKHTEEYFKKFRKNIISEIDAKMLPEGVDELVYADWAASGRLYRPIEDYIVNTLGPFVANTHTETTLTARAMTNAYHDAFRLIKEHVHASPDDIMIFAGAGMTAAINKLLRILGLRVPERYKPTLSKQTKNCPLIILTHMEHHSNQTSWLECICDVEILNENSDGLPDLNHLRELLQNNKERKMIIGAFTACSNVTGIITPYHDMSEIMHEFDRYCFIDFAGSAPYMDMDMHPAKESQRLDAIYLSPHKFLGGPGSSGVVIFNKDLYFNSVPDHPGGGTVTWTNPWGEHHYFDDVEVREDGGTPGFLQGIRAALAFSLKEKMGVKNILEREHVLTNRFIDRIEKIPEITVLEGKRRNRVGFISFYVDDIHYNLVVRLLNDRFGIQTRGGCSCAGTYGHRLLNINYEKSHQITDRIDKGEMGAKPGWVRVSIHPTMTDQEIIFIGDSIETIVENHKKWSDKYHFNPNTGDFDIANQHRVHFNLREAF